MTTSFNARLCIVVLFLLLCIFNAAIAQDSQPKAKKEKAEKKGLYQPGPLFQSDSLLEFKLTGNLRDVYSDRDPNSVQYRPMLLQVNDQTLGAATIGIRVKSRGHFRRMRENCSMPPLWINIDSGAKIKGTVFEKQNKLKLVTPCQGDDFVVREYLVYRLYNILTPFSLRARLAKVTFQDSAGKVKTQSQYCMLLEDEDKAAKRNDDNNIRDEEKVTVERLDPEDFTRVAMFEYLIGNTDWSVPYLHNIILAFKDSAFVPTAIPYDFDHSGIVSAPYANPPEQLQLSSVRERVYRGYCQEMKEFEANIALYNKLKDEIYKLYTDCRYIDDKYKKATVRYLDDFYKVINTPKTAEREFRRVCSGGQKYQIGGY